MPIVDTGNYYPQRDGRIAPIEDGTPESDWVGQRLGHPVIKAFNTIYAQHLMYLGKPGGERGAAPVDRGFEQRGTSVASPTLCFHMYGVKRK